jgi:hypothetical protein
MRSKKAVELAGGSCRRELAGDINFQVTCVQKVIEVIGIVGIQHE